MVVQIQLDSTKPPERRQLPAEEEGVVGKADARRSPVSPDRLFIAEEPYSSPQNSQTTDISPVGSTQSGGSAVKTEDASGVVNFPGAGSPSPCSAKSSISKSPQFPSSAASCRSVSSATSFLTATSTTNTSTSPSLSASSTASTGSTTAGGVTSSSAPAVQTLPRKHSAPPFPGSISGVGAGTSLAMGGADYVAVASPSALSDSIQLAIAKQSSAAAEHKASIPVEKRHKCPVCDKAFPYLSILESHKRCHTGEKPFCCHFCDKAFAQKATLQVHERTHTGERPYQCRYCPKTFAQYGTKTVHEKSAHLGIRNYKCPKCSKCLSSPSALYTHKKTHGEKTYQCQFCPKQFTLKNYLKLHVKQVHEQNERKHQCRYCQKTFAYAGSLQVHVRTHTGERPYMCRYCPKAFASQGNLQSHERTHTGERPFACQLCGRAFIQKSQLSAHEATHAHKNHHHTTTHSASIAPVSSGESAIVTLASAAVSIASCEQQRGEHGSEDSSTSELIDIEGDYTGEEEEEHHANDSPLSKSEAASSLVYGHRPTPNTPTLTAGTAGTKPSSSSNEFVCKYCGKRYAYASSLYVHTRLHTGERPFRCGYCSKEFTNQGNMQVHQRVHTGERPYKCESCGKCYAQKVGLKIHQEQCQPYLSRRGSVATNASSTNDSEMSVASGCEDSSALAVTTTMVAANLGGVGEQHTTQPAVNGLTGLGNLVLDSQLISINAALASRAPQFPLQHCSNTSRHLNSSGAVYSQAHVLHSTPQSSQSSSVFTSPLHSHRPSVTELFPTCMPAPAHRTVASNNSSINHGELEAHLLRLISQQQQQPRGREEPVPKVFQDGHGNDALTSGLMSSPPPNLQAGLGPGLINIPCSASNALVAVSSAGDSVASTPTVLSPLAILQQHQQQQALLALLEQAHLQQQHQQQQQQQVHQLRQLLLLKSILELENQSAAPTATPQPLVSCTRAPSGFAISSPSNGQAPNSMLPLPQPQPIYPASSASSSSGDTSAANSQFHQQLLQLLQAGGQDLIVALQQQQPAPSSSSQ